MLLTREEQTYDFGGARFDLTRDREVLSWIFSQFLFGEVTGVQVGEWLAQAPDFDAARFLARQANEEMAHVQLFLRILRSLEAEPQPPHPALKFLATDFAGGTFLEHCCLEMALGEGFVLMAIYALIDTLPDSEVRNLLVGLSRQEETHVAFGEEHTLRGLHQDPAKARHLLGLALVSFAGIRRLGGWIRRRYPTHPVLTQMPGFLSSVVDAAELRLSRLGVVRRPVARIPFGERAGMMASSVARRYARPLNPFRSKPEPLTETYLTDATVRTRLAGSR
ncbi:MAG: ferritin-like domain-containing protein [Actinomycetota bacterium]|nr:ferritin-like domain-containing protein [Actinomycetota bacterium]